MHKDQDAYGQEIWSFYKTGKGSEIVERDDGFIDTSVYGPSAYFKDYKDWSDLEKKAIRYARGRVLDVGCGAGRVALYLQKKGLPVTGIDNSPLAVRTCRIRGVQNALVRPIEEIRKFPRDSFDSIVMFGNNFGLFGGFRKARALLKTLHRITGEKAIIIASSNDPYGTKNPCHLAYQKFNRRLGRMSGQLRIRIRYQKAKGQWFDYLLASPGEMRKILAGTGWRLSKTVRTGSSLYFGIIVKNH